MRSIAARLEISRNTVAKAVSADSPPSYVRAPQDSGNKAVEAAIRTLLLENPRMPVTVLAERVGWSGSPAWFRENVARIRPEYAPADPDCVAVAVGSLLMLLDWLVVGLDLAGRAAGNDQHLDLFPPSADGELSLFVSGSCKPGPEVGGRPLPDGNNKAGTDHQKRQIPLDPRQRDIQHRKLSGRPCPTLQRNYRGTEIPRILTKRFLCW
jgi:hypothetical protein